MTINSHEIFLRAIDLCIESKEEFLPKFSSIPRASEFLKLRLQHYSDVTENIAMTIDSAVTAGFRIDVLNLLEKYTPDLVSHCVDLYFSAGIVRIALGLSEYPVPNLTLPILHA
jgi:hypothetical protein